MKWFFIWTLACLALFSITLSGVLLAQQASNTNNLQDLQIKVLRNNITYLEILEQLIATNITSLQIRVTILETQITVMWSDMAVIETDVGALYNTSNATFLSLADIHANLTNINITLQQQFNNVTTTWNQTLDLIQQIEDLNSTLTAEVNGILLFVHGVLSVNHNVDLLGQCGIIVYPSMTPATVEIDTSAIQSQIDALTFDLNATIFQLFKEIILSNTTIAQVNYQYPIFGEIILEAGNDGVSIVPNYNGSITVTNMAVTHINTLNGDVNGNINLVAGYGMNITNDAPNSLFITNLDSSYVSNQIASEASIEITHQSQRHILVENAFAKRTAIADNTSFTCSGINAVVATYSPILNTIVPFFANSVGSPCRYRASPTGGINLNDTNATYLLSMRWSCPGRRYTTAYNSDIWNIFEELWYCIGAQNCAVTGAGASYPVKRVGIRAPPDAGGVYPDKTMPMDNTYVAVFQSGATIPANGNWVSFAWRYYYIFPTAATVGLQIVNPVGELHVQRIG